MPYTIEVDRKALDRLVAEAQKEALRKQLDWLERKYPGDAKPRRKGRRRKRKAKGKLSAAGRAAISRGVRKSNKERAKARRQE
jgi:hypothetical protein